MKTRWIIEGVLAGGFLTGVLLTAQGCGGTSIASYCEKLCNCIGCSQTERDDCVTHTEDSRKTAGDKGCESDFNAAMSCVANGQCIDDELSTAGCASELEALDKCGVGVAKDACEQAANDFLAKYEECGITIASGSTSPSTSATCTEADAKLFGCLAACLPYVDCPCLKDPNGPTCADDQKKYFDCQVAC